MGVLLRQNDTRSQLQEKLANELREKAKQQAAGNEPLDQARDSRYIKDTDVVGRPSSVWIAILVICALAVLIFMFTR